MPSQNRFQTFNLPIQDQDGLALDASTLSAAEYVIFDCCGTKKVHKTLANGGLYVATLNGVNILAVNLTADETKDLCGMVNQELKVATTASNFFGVNLSSPRINFVQSKI